MSPKVKAICIILMLLLILVGLITGILLRKFRNRLRYTSERALIQHTNNFTKRPSISIPTHYFLNKSTMIRKTKIHKDMYVRNRVKRSLLSSKPNGTRHDRNTDINVQLPVGSSDHISDEYIEELAQSILGKLRSSEDHPMNPSADQKKEDEDEEDINESEEVYGHGPKPIVKSAFECDEWDAKKSVCYFDRNIGDTLTFQLLFENIHKGHVIRIQWKQEYHVKYLNHSKSVEINSEDTFWNVVIGSNDKELRVSPIIETDLDFNRFVAVAHISDSDYSPRPISRKIAFAIRPVPNDLGNVYPGEQLILYMRSYVSLPLESIDFHWFYEREGEKSTLPSNMKVSPSGSTIKISELRREQEGIISCAVYKASHLFLTKKRFLVQEISKGKSNIESTQLKPTHAEDTVLHRYARQVDPPKDSIIPQMLENQPPLQNNQMIQHQLFEQQPNLMPGNTLDFPPCLQPPCAPQQSIPNPPGYHPPFVNPTAAEDITLELGRRENLGETVEDRLAEMIAKCTSDKECSGHASCMFDLDKQGTCRCLPRYRGNGLFCWEMIIPGQTTAD